jgi:hypothetical protein
MSAERKEPLICHCAKCKHEWAPCFLPMMMSDSKSLRAMKAPCPACGHKDQRMGMIPRASAEGDIQAWLRNGDTGISSLTIANALARVPSNYFDVPHDPDDFGRCYRLLKVMPGWRARLNEVAAQFPDWKPLVAAWDELTALYEQELPSGTAPRLYKRIQELRTAPELPEPTGS